MKRVRVECGICKATRFYSIHRGITRIAGVVACEACRHFYQRFKKQPWVVNCSKGGKCFEQDETPKSKCKACWVAHIICRCPVSVNLYNYLVGYLPTELRSKMRGKPPVPEDVPDSERGGLGLEVYKGSDWVDVTNKEELDSLTHTEEAVDIEEPNEADLDMEFETEEESVDDPGVPVSGTAEEASSSSSSANQASTSTGSSIATSTRAKRSSSSGSTDNQSGPAKKGSDVVMASLLEGLTVKKSTKFMENFNPKTSERVRRKKKMVQYFSSEARTKGVVHGPDGAILSTGKNLCDCLQGDCPGCHFPCPKCHSAKCGSECRMNRKWYYEKIEIEGTNLTWTNEFVVKP